MSCAFILEHKRMSLPPPQLLENEAGTQGALPRDILLSVVSCHAIHLPTSSVDLWSWLSSSTLSEDIFYSFSQMVAEG